MQAKFDRAVALLHNFHYPETVKAFQAVIKDDPDCAIAYWGLAMSAMPNPLVPPFPPAVVKTAQEAIQQGKAAKTQSPREAEYLAAIDTFFEGYDNTAYPPRAEAYEQAMQRLSEHYRDDSEARIFYALALNMAVDFDDAKFTKQLKAAAILKEEAKRNPNHPGIAHYLIHSYDKPQLAELGIPAARRYAQVAPAAPHALHMPSHIFARVGLWQDDINSNLASVAATRKTAAMHMGGEGHQFHAMDFLVYAYLQSGREAEAQKIIDEIKTMPKMESMYGHDFDPQTNALSAFPALYDLELRHWSDAAAMNPVPGATDGDLSITHWARAIGAARSGNLAQAHKDLAEIENIRQKALAEKKADFAEGVMQDYQEAEAWILHAEEQDDKAVAMLRSLADKNDKLGDEPGWIPAREMLADLLLEAKRPQQALVEYQTDLKLNPNRFNGLYGAARAAEAAGKQSDANEYYALLLKTCEGGSSTRPELSHAKELLAKK